MIKSDPNYPSPPQPSDKLSFSARDLLTRLVREDCAIRGKVTILAEPVWFHQGTCPEITLQIADVRELSQHGFIEFWKEWIQPESSCTAHPRQAEKWQERKRLPMPRNPRRTLFIKDNLAEGNDIDQAAFPIAWD